MKISFEPKIVNQIAFNRLENNKKENTTSTNSIKTGKELLNNGAEARMNIAKSDINFGGLLNFVKSFTLSGKISQITWEDEHGKEHKRFETPYDFSFAKNAMKKYNCDIELFETLASMTCRKEDGKVVPRFSNSTIIRLLGVLNDNNMWMFRNLVSENIKDATGMIIPKYDDEQILSALRKNKYPKEEVRKKKTLAEQALEEFQNDPHVYKRNLEFNKEINGYKEGDDNLPISEFTKHMWSD